jgi:hypothetical protein
MRARKRRCRIFKPEITYDLLSRQKQVNENKDEPFNNCLLKMFCHFCQVIHLNNQPSHETKGFDYRARKPSDFITIGADARSSVLWHKLKNESSRTSAGTTLQ